MAKEEFDKDALEDFFFIREFSQEKILEQIISLCTGRLKKFGNYNFFENIQILTPTKKGMLGTKELNKAMQQVLNPADGIKKEKKAGNITYRVGDRIMQIKNNYDIYWEKQSMQEAGTGVEIKFDDEKVALYEFSELEQIEHSYAITIHKAQRK